MHKGFWGFPFDIGSAIPIEDIGDQKVMITRALKSGGPAKKPGAAIVYGRGSGLTPAGVTNPLKRVFRGFSKPGQEVLAPFGEGANGEIRARLKQRAQSAPLCQGDTEPGRFKGTLLDPTGQHGLVGARFGISRGDHEKPAGNAAKGPPNGIQMFRSGHRFFMVVFHTGILVAGR